MSSPLNSQRIRTKASSSRYSASLPQRGGDHGSSPSRMVPVQRPWSSINQGHGPTYGRRSRSSRAVRPTGDAGSPPAAWPVPTRGPGRPGAGRGDRPQSRCGAVRVTPARLLVVARTRPGPVVSLMPPTRRPASPAGRAGRRHIAMVANDRQGVGGDRADGDVTARPGWPGKDDHLVVVGRCYPTTSPAQGRGVSRPTGAGTYPVPSP
jgi:hypothetical protein